jgi:hypothetical protein
MGKFKKNLPKREKKLPVYRTREERQEEARKIISTLSELQLDLTYEPIKMLYKHLNEYIEKGERILVNIPFKEVNRRIRGVLAISVRENVWIKMEKEKF